MRSVDQIIDAAGGPRQVGQLVGLKDGPRKWPVNGIPDRYWAALIGQVPGLTPDEIFNANEAVRVGGRPAPAGRPGAAEAAPHGGCTLSHAGAAVAGFSAAETPRVRCEMEGEGA